MIQKEFSQDNQFRNLINLEGIELPLFNNVSNNEEPSSLRNLINIESLPTNFVNQQKEEELNSEDKTLNPLCVELPEKDEYLRKKNYLGEFFLEEDKAEARANLGITPLLDELKALIQAKLVDEAGNLRFDLLPTSGETDPEAYGKVLSSAIIYNILLNYYNKDEIELYVTWAREILNDIRSSKSDKSNTYTKEEVNSMINSISKYGENLDLILERLDLVNLSLVATSGDYNDLINIPTELSLFNNDIFKPIQNENIDELVNTYFNITI